MGSNTLLKVFGITFLKLKLDNGMEKVLTTVRHVLELKRNLIFIEILDEWLYY